MVKALHRPIRQAALLLAASLFTLPLISCGGGSESDDDGDSSSDFTLDACNAVGLKIVNGTACSADENPGGTSVVRLAIYDVTGQVAGFCTGTVIAPNVVLTAAHCFVAEPTAIDVETFIGTFSARSWRVQPGYTSIGDTQYGDAALVFTRDNIPLPVAPILASRAPQVGEEAIVAGFGATGPDSGATDFLVAGNAFVTDVSSNHVTIRFRDDESHPCFGDSGGPLLLNVGGVMTVAGVVSQSDPSVPSDTICTVGDITLYTNTENSGTAAFIFGNVPNATTR